ncbi:Family with sequence similarity 47, member E [Apodemus speciosus]|uniref:Family with sequence similarity 47, member E n=1 Tax=Apodemus speciosus TaxID=105296 RepID=A0ABQ0ES34_APOSI
MLLLQVLEVLDPERKLEDLWDYCQDTRKPTKEPTKLREKRSSEVCLPKKMLVWHSGQWLCEEKPSKVDSIYKNSLLHDGVRRGVSDFCHWAADLGLKQSPSTAQTPSSRVLPSPSMFPEHGLRSSELPAPQEWSARPEWQGSAAIQEELVLQQFDMDYQTSCDALPRPRLNELTDSSSTDHVHCEDTVGAGVNLGPRKSNNPQKPKRVKMRYGAWYLNTNLWKRQRVDEPLVDPKVSHKARDSNFKKQLQEQEELLAGLRGTAAFKDFILSRGYKMPRFLEKIYAEEKVLGSKACATAAARRRRRHHHHHHHHLDLFSSSSSMKRQW